MIPKLLQKLIFYRSFYRNLDMIPVSIEMVSIVEGCFITALCGKVPQKLKFYGIFTFVISCIKFHLNMKQLPLVQNHKCLKLFMMKRDIYTFFLISVVLTFHGTEADCRRTCEDICRFNRGREGLNCCSGTQGGYGRNNKYDRHNACREGICDLREYSGYVPCAIMEKY